MKIEERPTLPYVDKKLVDKYLTVLQPETEYTAYTIDNDYKVVEGKGKIDSDGSYNYHNNYDDSENTLIFTSKNKASQHRWWTLNKSEAEELCLKERTKLIGLLHKEIKKLER